MYLVAVCRPLLTSLVLTPATGEQVLEARPNHPPDVVFNAIALLFPECAKTDQMRDK